jgi:hypothetical protein
MMPHTTDGNVISMKMSKYYLLLKTHTTSAIFIHILHNFLFFQKINKL